MCVTKPPFEDWIEAVKEECAIANVNYDDAASVYPFYKAWDEFDMKPNEAVVDYIMQWDIGA